MGLLVVFSSLYIEDIQPFVIEDANVSPVCHLFLQCLLDFMPRKRFRFFIQPELPVFSQGFL